MKRAPSVFISYSWDSAAHKRWVLRLAERLKRNGVRVWIDQLSVRPGDSLTRFMEEKIRSSGHVIVVCTPNYAKRSNKRIGGVGYEQQIISGRIAAGIPRRKFIPVVRSGELRPGARCALPEHFYGTYVVDLRAKLLASEKLEEILRSIFNRKTLKAARQSRTKQDLIRLPSAKLDGWSLSSGVDSNRRYPKSFWIPKEKERTNLRTGDLGKLIFNIRERDGNTLGERMWVEMTGTLGPYYLGELRNAPISDQPGRTRRLRWGSPIVFLPEHIIDIVRKRQQTRSLRRSAPRAKK